MSVIEEIAAERKRQVEQEGWTQEHDLSHGSGDLALAGASYALHMGLQHRASYKYKTIFPDYRKGVPIDWPWEDRWWKPKDTRRDLVRGAALIVAEIERMDADLTDWRAER